MEHPDRLILRVGTATPGIAVYEKRGIVDSPNGPLVEYVLVEEREDDTPTAVPVATGD